MKHLHVRNLEKYQDGYKDRRHIWAKIQVDMVMGDPDCEMIRSEIDWARLIKFIVLETCSRKQIPLDEEFLRRRGFDFKKRPLKETLSQIAHFIDVTENEETVTEPSLRVEKNRVEKNRVEFENFWASYPKKRSKGQAEKAWTKIKPDEQLQDRILNALERAKTSADWQKDHGQFIPHPATWLNAKGWEDENCVSVGVVKREKKPDQDCQTCGGNGQLPDGRGKCWCWK